MPRWVQIMLGLNAGTATIGKSVHIDERFGSAERATTRIERTPCSLEHMSGPRYRSDRNISIRSNDSRRSDG
jgi:hypothetical protein